jgi:phage tail-like protein
MRGLARWLCLSALASLALVVAGPDRLVAQPVPPPTRADPYKSYRFKLELGGRYVAAFRSAVLPEVIEYRSGGDPSTSHKSPGRNKYTAITLDRGVTTDPAFDAWAASGLRYRGAAPPDPALRNLRLLVFDGAGHVVGAYRIYRAWVSEHQSLPDLDAGANAIAIEHTKLESEGWERDMSITEPAPRG